MDYLITVGSFERVEKEWSQLLSVAVANHVFLTPQWQRAWWRCFGGEYELLLLVVQRNGELVAIVPLMRCENTISFIGNSDVCDYMDFVVHREDVTSIMPHVMDYLESLEWETIDLHSLRPDSVVLRYFAPLAVQRNFSVDIIQEDVSPQLVLPPTWEHYLALLRGKDRHELKRKLRRLESTRALRYYTFTGAEGLEQALDGFYRLFKLSDGEKGRFMTERRLTFFEAMAWSLVERGYFRLVFLDVGSVQVAAAMCFDYNGDIYLYNSGYDPAYSSLSVGLLTKVFCLRGGIDEGKKRFDFLRGAESYKYDLGAENVAVYRCVITRSGRDAYCRD